MRNLKSDVIFDISFITGCPARSGQVMFRPAAGGNSYPSRKKKRKSKKTQKLYVETLFLNRAVWNLCAVLEQPSRQNKPDKAK